jgi:LysM repeat protein
MAKVVLLIIGFVFFGSVSRAQSAAVEFANMREDVRLLTQRVGELSLKVEQLERENAALKSATGNAATSATVSQLNQAVVELRTAITAGDTATAERASAQIKKLGEATNAALDTMAKGQAQRAAVQTTFSTDFPAEGVSYTVQKGDTIAIIARKTGAKLSDIINANKIADPSRIRVGDTLFIPAGK